MLRRFTLVTHLLSQSLLATKSINPTTTGVCFLHLTTVVTKVQFAKMAGKYTSFEKGAANSTDYRVFFSKSLHNLHILLAKLHLIYINTCASNLTIVLLNIAIMPCANIIIP